MMSIQVLRTLAERGYAQSRLQASLQPLAPAHALRRTDFASVSGAHAALRMLRTLPPKTAVCDFSDLMQRRITAEIVSQLHEQRYAVLDDVFPTHLADEFAREIVDLQANNGTHKNATHLLASDGSRRLLPKEGIFEAEVTHDTAAAASCPAIHAWSQDTSARTMLSILWPMVAPDAPLNLTSQATKLQYNVGAGSCFPMHFDAYQDSDGRRITQIVYLNKGWTAEDGGELQLYPLPGRAVNIVPHFNRMVLFLSTGTLHRVQPSRTARLCFTTWLSQSQQRPRDQQGASLRPTKVPDASSPANEVNAFLMHPAVYPHACKLACASLWQQSLLESHSRGPALDSLLSELVRELDVLDRQLGPLVRAAGWPVNAASTEHVRI